MTNQMARGAKYPRATQAYRWPVHQPDAMASAVDDPQCTRRDPPSTPCSGRVLVEVMADALRGAMDGLVDLEELGQATEAGVPVEQLVEGLVDHGVAEAGGLQLQAGLLVELAGAERHREGLVERLAAIEPGDDLARQVTHRLRHAVPPLLLVTTPTVA